MININDISVNLSTGEMSYPKLDGFVLDLPRMYSSFERFLPHCATPEMALKQAIHQQMIAHSGMANIRRLVGQRTRS